MIAQREARPDLLEPHYTLGELAKAWHMSRRILKEWFRDEVGVIKYGSEKLKKGRERTHLSMRIPHSIAVRVYRRRTGREVYPAKGN